MTNFERIGEGLATAGYAVLPNFFSEQDVARFRGDLLQFSQQGQMRAAAVGRGASKVAQESIRRDAIFWIEPGAAASEVQSELSLFTENLRTYLNSQFYLGLWSFEGHYAHYAGGAFYKRHSDVFQNSDARVISLVLYLNEPNWNEEDGGELRIYLSTEAEHETFIDVVPRGGTLVCFVSDRFEHEVRPAKRDRYSFTGWFRKRT